MGREKEGGVEPGLDEDVHTIDGLIIRCIIIIAITEVVLSE
jgi:hypothetical protein